ncbi:TspO/MBR family protein [Gottfriedia luciferensis]|uniref:TspO/MBR family protein n=1 Tax=Gottfriedia luciferensis TaxID=178774 RepID=UPI000B437D8D|nr:TspO/MBR family protein [Gottfriedia luciferensis]
MNKKLIVLFFLLYCLFFIASLLFPINQDWYSNLVKPNYTPSEKTIGMICAFLYSFISLSVCVIVSKEEPFKKVKWFYIVFSINYLFNQLFIYFEFKQQDLRLATIDCGFVAVTAIILVLIAYRHSKVSSLLLIPYTIWSIFATYLNYTIYVLNL